MINFLKRLFGFTVPGAAKPAAEQCDWSNDGAFNTVSFDPDQELAWQAQVDIDGLFFNWLQGNPENPGHDSSGLQDATAKAIIVALERLCSAEMVGANLVPRLPSILPQLLKSLREENVSSGELARHISKDMVLMAELIQEVNSSYYNPVDKIVNLDNAIRMLGQNGVRMLVARMAFRPIINVQSGHLTKLVTPLLWEQAEKCAIACRQLAQQQKQDPFVGFLAGLMQNVGLVVAFRIVDQVCEPGQIPNSAQFKAALLAQSRILSCCIGRQWGFPASVIRAIQDQARYSTDLTGLSLSLRHADHLSKIYLLVNHAQLKKDDPLLQLDQNARIAACYEALSTQQA